MEFKNEFKSVDYKPKKEESLGSLYKLGSYRIENLDTRSTEDENDFRNPSSLKNCLSKIKSMRLSKELEINSIKKDDTSTIHPRETLRTKPPNKNERLQRLEKSLSGLQSNVELKRSTILEDIYQKINKLENKIKDSQLSSTKNIDLMNKRIESVENTIDRLNKKHEEVIREKADAIDNICEKFHHSLLREQENWRTWEENIIHSINEQIGSVREEISGMQRLKSDIVSNLKVYVDVELPSLKRQIEKVSSEIEEMEEKVIKNTSEDLLSLANFIRDEQEKMHSLKEKIVDHINTELGSLQFSLRKETEEREDTQKKLVFLMEETVKRLESPL